MCITCRSNKNLYAYFEYDKVWNKTTKQWDFINIREITNPTSSWFEGDINSVTEAGGDAGSGSSGGGGANLRGSKPSGYQEDRDTRGARDSRELGKLQSSNNSKSVSISSASLTAKRQEMSAKVAAMKLQLDKLTNEYASLEDNVKWNKMQMDKAEKDCYDMNVKLRIAIRDYTKAESVSIMYIKDKKETDAANTLMYTINQKTREICDNYSSLKDKYMKSVNELNSLKNKISDLRAQYDKANASSGSGGGGSSSGSFLSPIINIFFGDEANRDCSGQLGCGNGVDYSFPSPFNSAVGGKFTPQPFYGGIRL